MRDEANSEQLADEELAAATGEPLPERAAMSIIRTPGPEPIPLPADEEPGFTTEPVPPATA